MSCTLYLFSSIEKKENEEGGNKEMNNAESNDKEQGGVCQSNGEEGIDKRGT